MQVLFDQLRAQRAALAGVFALATINQLLLLAEPHVLRLIVDRWIVRAASVPWPLFFGACSRSFSPALRARLRPGTDVAPPQRM